MKKNLNELFDLLEKYKLTLTAAESITGGNFSALITSKEGSSKYFKGSFVCYSNNFKYDILNVSRDIEIISKEMAEELAINSRKLANADISISFTGNSSENGIENKEKGLSYISISNGNTTQTIEFKSLLQTREEIISDTTNNGLDFILNFIRNNYK